MLKKPMFAQDSYIVFCSTAIDLKSAWLGSKTRCSMYNPVIVFETVIGPVNRFTGLIIDGRMVSGSKEKFMSPSGHGIHPV